MVRRGNTIRSTEKTKRGLVFAFPLQRMCDWMLLLNCRKTKCDLGGNASIIMNRDGGAISCHFLKIRRYEWYKVKYPRIITSLFCLITGTFFKLKKLHYLQAEHVSTHFYSPRGLADIQEKNHILQFTNNMSRA